MERDVVFDGGVAFGVDKALIPLGFGGNCDDIKETQITVIVVMALAVLLEISFTLFPINKSFFVVNAGKKMFFFHRANVEIVLFLLVVLKKPLLL